VVGLLLLILILVQISVQLISVQLSSVIAGVGNPPSFVAGPLGSRESYSSLWHSRAVVFPDPLSA
jgi:hypothetical protein